MSPVKHQTVGATTSPGKPPLEAVQDDLEPEPEALIGVRPGPVVRDVGQAPRSRHRGRAAVDREFATPPMISMS
jgi:hypothetical protein